jgi:hypothetical protein
MPPKERDARVKIGDAARPVDRKAPPRGDERTLLLPLLGWN